MRQVGGVKGAVGWIGVDSSSSWINLSAPSESRLIKKEWKCFPVNCHLQFLCLMRTGSTKTHQRPECEVRKRFKSPGGSSSPAHPLERHGLPHSLSCQADGRKRRNTSWKISTGSRNLLRFMPSPNPQFQRSLKWFSSPSFSSLTAFHFHLFVFPTSSCPTPLCTFSVTFFLPHTCTSCSLPRSYPLHPPPLYFHSR